jgi:hypothetical protein
MAIPKGFNQRCRQRVPIRPAPNGRGQPSTWPQHSRDFPRGGHSIVEELESLMTQNGIE